MSTKTLTFSIMDGPFEQARTTTAFRMIHEALDRGYNVNVFAYEGAVSLAFAHQKPHANAVHGRSVEEEDHPLTKDWIAALQEKAKAKGCQFDWINCGLCVDERGVNDAIDGCRRGKPSDLWKWASESDGTLIIATK
ncbi:DsrE/DsrF/TusD sulfur relay family protein [Coleofasciculus sp. E1-EBD-02]|uniref:DsrE/DsrF/TusD sulfur relay family protein n=1 Tax=unclassified Coleofasciculus TaxID=2692782 RepID=UPI0032F23631